MEKKIWVIDDDLSILEVVKIILEDSNYNVLTISEVEEFNKKIKKELPDLILLDFWMSGTDGKDIAKSLKSQKETKKIPIVMVSALSDCKKIAKESGADGYLSKPFDMDDLINTVKKYTS